MAAVMKTLRDGLGAIFTPVVAKAWKVTLNIVEATMIGDNYEPKEVPKPKELPEDQLEEFLKVESPKLQKGDTYLNLESNGFEAQNTFRGINENEEYMVSMTIRSDRNEDTMRPMRGITQREEHLEVPFDSSKVKFSKKNSEILS
jgi:hypothetical protein